MDERKRASLTPSAPPGPARGILAATILAAALFWPALQSLAAYWIEDPDFSHGFLVPAIAGGILYSRRKDWRTSPSRLDSLGFLIFVASLVLFLAGHLTLTNIFARLGMWGALVGAAIAILGWRWFRAEGFPFVFLLFAIPPPYVLLNPLKLALKAFATRVAADLLGLAGLAARAEGNVLAIGDHQLEVADACSGIRSLVAIAATAVLFAYILRTGWLRGALLVATAVPVTIIVNVARVVLLAVALERFDLDLTRGAAHEALGIAIFAGAMACLWASWCLYAWLFRWSRASAGAPFLPGRVDPAAGSPIALQVRAGVSFRISATLVLFLATRIVYDAVFAPDLTPEPLRVPLRELPMDVFGDAWRGRDVPLDEETLRMAGVSSYLQRSYEHQGKTLWLYVGYVSGSVPEAVHHPAVCFPSSGMSLERNEVLSFQAPDGEELKFREYVWRHSRGGGTYTLSTFYYGGKCEPEEWKLRAERVLGVRYFAVITLSGSLSGSLEETRGTFRELAGRLFPLLVRHFPR